MKENTPDSPIPPIDELVEQVKSKITIIMTKTLVHSGRASRAEADEVNTGLNRILGTDYGLEYKGSDITAATLIGTFHWYSSKLYVPEKEDLKPSDIPKHSDLKVLEIRRHDADKGNDNRATFIMGTDEDELKAVTEGVSAFYKAKGYEQLPSWNKIADRASDQETKF